MIDPVTVIALISPPCISCTIHWCRCCFGIVHSGNKKGIQTGLFWKMPYKELPWCLRRRLEECLKSFEGVRGLANWRPRWLLNLKGSFFDGTLVNRSATPLFGHPVYVTAKMDLKSERFNVWWHPVAQKGLILCWLLVEHPMPDAIVLHLMGKDEARERILGEEVKKN